MYDPVVRAGTLVEPTKSERGHVAVPREWAAAVGSRSVDEEAVVPIDATGYVVIPRAVAPQCRYDIGFGRAATRAEARLAPRGIGGETADHRSRPGGAPTSLHDDGAAHHEHVHMSSVWSGPSPTTRSDFRACSNVGASHGRETALT